ncbi:DUF397 domain-containing protein [Nocardiopsis sp. HNM0947]|uniref:DUF397 domain-containing protein n=1 Tax=Nocardiopsis coralli TaxID=2772213 RepID=A0ABR9P8Y8_9ACTN|nr:DUF397 domain-containing protein [Nocardiopsis coralli]MBE3000155.1 DUF397 domain-containing protein [Nocardiopsis coralli]
MQLNFHKSSHSTTAQECVEVAEFSSGAAVRDTQHREDGYLVFSATEWRAALGALGAPAR